MRKPRTNILLLTIILVIVGLVSRAWPAREPVVPSPMNVVTERIALPSLRQVSAQAVDPNADFAMPVSRPTSTPPLQLSADASVLVTEMCGLQLLAEGAELSFENDQLTAFAAVVLRYQAIRHHYEAQIADLKVIVPGRYRVEIPTYAKVGDELRAQFAADLRATLGEATALNVMIKLGDRLEKYFAGFGSSVQTLDVIADPAGEPGDMQLTRTISYGNRVEGSDRLTTRREVHFPALEDPTGDSWSSLLAMVRGTGQADGPG